MHELWSADSYSAHLLSVPFALAPAAMLLVVAYAVVMRGAPALRGWLLVHTLALLPYAIAIMLSPSITSPAAAEHLFRIAVGSIAVAGAAGTAFQLALVRASRGWRWLGAVLVVASAVWIPISATTDLVLDGVARISDLFWYPRAGRFAWLGFATTVLACAPGFALLGRAALTMKPSTERRQLRAALVANAVTYTGLVDVALAYGIGAFPVGWLLSGIGCLVVVRALVVEDLLRVRAVDATAPLLVIYFAGGAMLAWVSLAQIGAAPWWVAAPVLVVCFASVRLTVAVIGLINRGARGPEGTHDRLLAQLVGRARSLDEPTQIAQLAIDIVELGLGVRPTVLLAAAEDWGWTTADGARLADTAAPDPLLAGWLAEQRGARFVDDVEPVPPELRELLQGLFEHHAARAIVPVRSADELLGLVVVGAAVSARRVRGKSLAFVERAADRLAEALVHARLASRAADRAALAREVELAATVQAELLPDAAPRVFGADAERITAIGSWHPATRCAGDFWGAYDLGAGKVLVAVADVTGHGVASAMVTAAVAGACDVCVRRASAERDVLVDLAAALDAAVRRVGGGTLAMTCAAAVLDPRAKELRFWSAGHPAPYLVRPAAIPAAAPVELHALVARGNPFGIGPTGPSAPAVRVQQRPLQPGDLVVWYTDGVIEAQDPAGAPFGDRRLQHLLKKLDGDRLAPQRIHALVAADVAAHRAGRPLADDATLVVARWEAP